MTNAEMFLKEEQFMFDISKGIAEAICYDDMEHSKEITEKEIRNWFTSNIKLTLTEDERVILRNLGTGARTVKRTSDKSLYVEYCYIDYNVGKDLPYPHLFQFIKERRRILY